jgi:hypothetical protein
VSLVRLIIEGDSDDLAEPTKLTIEADGVGRVHTTLTLLEDDLVSKLVDSVDGRVADGVATYTAEEA